jgi:hypothetical protein
MALFLSVPICSTSWLVSVAELGDLANSLATEPGFFGYLDVGPALIDGLPDQLVSSSGGSFLGLGRCSVFLLGLG